MCYRLRGTHHITIDLANLLFHSPYEGKDDVIVGNDTCLKIIHTSSLSLSLSTSLLFWKVLSVPSINKNLLFVAQLYWHNNIVVVLTPTKFQVKNLQMGIIVHQSAFKDITYLWYSPLSSWASPLTLSMLRESISLWHNRYDDPSNRVMHHLFKSILFS